MAASTLTICLIASAGTAFAADPLKEYREFRPSSGELGNCRPSGGAIRATFLGTTTLLFDDGETQLMIDGFLTRPKRTTLLNSLRTDTDLVDKVLDGTSCDCKIDRLKALFVSHSHYDHALDAAYIAQRTGARLYGSDSTLNIGRGVGLHEGQMTSLCPECPVPVGAFTVTALRSRHSKPALFKGDIEEPLAHPAPVSDYREGGTFDFLITHGTRSMLVKGSADFVPGALDCIRADVLFLGTAMLGNKSDKFKRSFYFQTVTKVRPRLVIPVHWDDFTTPLSPHLEPPSRLIDNMPRAFDFLIAKLKAENEHWRSEDDQIKFRILQGCQGILLFESNDLHPSPL